jgi:hypothetical protein
MPTSEPPPRGQVFTTTAFEPAIRLAGPARQDFRRKKIQNPPESAKSG